MVLMVDLRCGMISFLAVQHFRIMMHMCFYDLGPFLAVPRIAGRLIMCFTHSLTLRLLSSWLPGCGASGRQVTLSNPVLSSLAVCYPDLFRVLVLAFTMPLSELIPCTHSSRNKLDTCLYHDLQCWIWVTSTVLALSEISRCLILSHKPSSWICDSETHSMSVICACSSLHVAAVEHDVPVLLAVFVFILTWYDIQSDDIVHVLHVYFRDKLLLSLAPHLFAVK